MTQRQILRSVLLTLSLLSTQSIECAAQDLNISSGDLVIRDSSENQLILLDHAGQEISVGGASGSGKLRLVDTAGTTRSLLSNGELELSRSTGFSTLIFSGGEGDIEAGGGSVDGDLVLKTSSNIPTFKFDGETGQVEIFDGGGTAESDRIYRLKVDSAAAEHWGDTRFSTSDYTLRTNDDFELHLDQAGSGDLTFGSFNINDNDGTEIFSVDEEGDLTASGTKSAVVETEEYGRVKLYAVESTENWFEDFGSSTLDKGVARVDLNPIFVETVNSAEPYHVTVTPTCKEPALLFVSERKERSFTVQGVSLRGAPSGCSFEYRVTAKRKGYEDIRLERMEEIDERIWAIESGQ